MMDKYLQGFDKLHERAKESLFWKDFNKTFLPDACKSIYDLEKPVVGYFYNLPKEERLKNAQFVLVDSLCHNVNALMLRLRGGRQEIQGNDILVLQSFLQNLHLLIDNVIPEEPFGLNPYGYKGKYQELCAVLNDDGETYRSVQRINPDQAQGVIDDLEDRRKKWFSGNSKLDQEIWAEYQEEIDLLKSGQKLTKWFKIIS